MTDQERKAMEIALETLDNISESGIYFKESPFDAYMRLRNMARAGILPLQKALAQPEQENISRCKQCGGALPVTGALDRTGECDCIGQLKVISTIAWFNAPIKTEWGEDMMCASVSIDKNHTLTLYCERSQIHKVPNIIKELL